MITAKDKVLNPGLQIYHKPSFKDSQHLFSNFRDQRSYDFLEEQNLNNLSSLSLDPQMTVVEKTLVTGDKIFAWGEVMMKGNQKELKVRLVSDSLIMQIWMVIVYLFIGVICLLIGSGMCKQFFM